MGFGSGTVCDISLNTTLTPEERALYQDASIIRDLLGSAKTIAVVGASSETTKPSSMVASYLMDEGYTVYPVNPRAGEILGVKAYPDLKSIPVPIDIVDIFRPPNEMPGIVEDAIAIGAKAVWMQLRLANIPAAKRAREAGLLVVADRCIKMEHGRYGGMLHWAGMNTEVVSAKRRQAGR